MDHEIFGMFAGVISLVGFITYLWSIKKLGTRPSAVSWFFWMIMAIISGTSHWSLGADYTIWIPIAYVLGDLGILIFSLRYGRSQWQKLDTFCFSGCAFCLILWWLFEPLVGLSASLVVHFLGTGPTFKKAWQNPKSENFFAWILFMAGTAINLAAVPEWTLREALYPIYLVAHSGLTLMLLGLGLKRQKTKFLLR